MTVRSGGGTTAGHNGHRRGAAAAGTAAAPGASPDALEPSAELFRGLRSAPGGLSGREAARRLEVTGSNKLAARFTRPLAVLLAVAAFVPEEARVLRDGQRTEIAAGRLVPGDILLIEEGERVCADARLMTGTVEVDMSTLAGESVPVARSADSAGSRVPLLQARDLVFSGTGCTVGEARAVVTATGMRTELAASPHSASGPGTRRARWNTRSGGSPG